MVEIVDTIPAQRAVGNAFASYAEKWLCTPIDGGTFPFPFDYGTWSAWCIRLAVRTLIHVVITKGTKLVTLILLLLEDSASCGNSMQQNCWDGWDGWDG